MDMKFHYINLQLGLKLKLISISSAFFSSPICSRTLITIGTTARSTFHKILSQLTIILFRCNPFSFKMMQSFICHFLYILEYDVFSVSGEAVVYYGCSQHPFVAFFKHLPILTTTYPYPFLQSRQVSVAFPFRSHSCGIF